MLKRSNPDIGYMAQDVFDAYAFTQTIRKGNHVYLSGIAPLHGNNDNVELAREID